MYKKKGQRIILLTLVMISSLFISIINAMDIEKVKEEIVKNNQYLKEEELSHQNEKDNSISTQNSLEDRIKVLEEDISGIEKEIIQLEKELESIDLSKKEKIIKKEISNKLISDIQNLLLTKTKELEAEIISGLPYDKKNRLMKIDDFNNKLEDKNTDILESCYGLANLYLGEIESGYTSEIYSAEIETEKGEVKKTNNLRIGNIILYYQTNDGEETAKAVIDKTGFKWESNLSRNCKTNIGKAIQIMEGKRVPELIELPVENDQVKKEELINDNK